MLPKWLNDDNMSTGLSRHKLTLVWVAIVNQGRGGGRRGGGGTKAPRVDK